MKHIAFAVLFALLGISGNAQKDSIVSYRCNGALTRVAEGHKTDTVAGLMYLDVNVTQNKIVLALNGSHSEYPISGWNVSKNEQAEICIIYSILDYKYSHIVINRTLGSVTMVPKQEMKGKINPIIFVFLYQWYPGSDWVKIGGR